jgi:hypothetical protein
VYVYTPIYKTSTRHPSVSFTCSCWQWNSSLEQSSARVESMRVKLSRPKSASTTQKKLWRRSCGATW